jgi:hypothetical protein
MQRLPRNVQAKQTRSRVSGHVSEAGRGASSHNGTVDVFVRVVPLPSHCNSQTVLGPERIISYGVH